MKQTRYLYVLCVSFLGVTTACLTPSTSALTSATGGSTAAPIISVPAGAKAAKFIFRQANPTGSFDASPAGGTVPTPGQGQQAIRVFNADGSLLASSTSSSAWPKWITSLEIGISGANNTAASNSDCARFAGANENISSCHFDGTTTGPTTPCGAAAGLFRVSEYDCAQSTPTNGNGGPNDGVYIRTVFSRDAAYLGASENIMAVLEYSASALNAAPSSPTACFSGGVFTPENCSDMTWRMYIKHNTSEVVQPYLLMVPPTFGYVNTTANMGGAGVSAKQFYIPLAGDPALTVMQISRIKSLAVSPSYTIACSSNGTGGTPANSALCVGMVLYSITFYRM